MRYPVLQISTKRFAQNIAAVRARVAPAEVMLVVKDDAYGHGVAWAVKAACDVGVSWIGTYDIPTAVEARSHIGEGPRLFAWATSADDEIVAALRAQVDLGVGTVEYLERVIQQATRSGMRARVHLKIDTGLHRNGIAPEGWLEAVRRALQAQEQGVLSLVGVWSHLAEASDEDDDDAHALFLRAVAQARDLGAQIEHTHLTASAATWARPELRGSLARVGAFCYGVRSADGPDLEGIEAIATLTARVSAVSGDSVTVDIGSLDGLPSTLAGKSCVGTVAGAQALLTVDFAESTVAVWPGARIGDEVTLFGPGARGESTATTLAEAIDTVGEEILTRVTPYVQRQYCA